MHNESREMHMQTHIHTTLHIHHTIVQKYKSCINLLISKKIENTNLQTFACEKCEKVLPTATALKYHTCADVSSRDQSRLISDTDHFPEVPVQRV